MIALKTNVVKWEIVCEKIHFADPVKDAKSVAGFFPSRQFGVGPNEAT